MMKRFANSLMTALILAPSLVLSASGDGNWSPCFSDEDARAMGLPNRDAAGVEWCKSKGYDGVEPNVWRDCGNWKFEFRCAQHWSPCYRDEDGKPYNLNRDGMGNKWCKDNGYGGKSGNYQDCGNWYFKFQCKN